jgi:hypothetical protein
MAPVPKSKAITTNNIGGIGTLFNPYIPFDNPRNSQDANLWRYVARKQPVVMDCISSLTMNVQSKPWDIRARDANDNDELKDSINYHKKIVLEAGGFGYLNLIDTLLQDYYMIPFGGAVETVRYSDGKLFKIVFIDGSTLYPNMNVKFPVYQKVGTNDPIFFQDDELARIIPSPRPEIERKGWGMTPIEKTYLAIELLARGDRYYAQLLLDTPEAGILDLGDMSQESAEKWLDGFRNLMSGIDPFKIPVIYQHTKEVKWIPFGRPPTDMLFSEVTHKYAQIVCASFGLTTSDIGITNNAGGALSGAIREERHSRATGFASIKSKLTEFFNKILPEELEFAFIDTDDELLVSKGRARSANAVAGRNFIESGALTPIEWRKQMQADGLITIPLTEEPDESEFDILKEIDGTADQLDLQQQQVDIAEKQADNAVKIAKMRPTGGANPKKGGQGGKGLNKQRNVRGGKLESVQGKEPKPASGGGQGEVKSETDNVQGLEKLLKENFNNVIDKISVIRSRRLIKTALRNNYHTLKSASVENDYSEWKVEYLKMIFGQSENESIQKAVYDQIKSFSETADKDKWWEIHLDEDELQDALSNSFTLGLEDAANSIQAALYENGLVDSPDVNKSFELEDDKEFERIFDYAVVFSELVNSGTDFFVKRLSLASVAEASEQPEYLEKLKSGASLDDLLEDDGFINSAAEIFRNNLTSIMENRIKSIAVVENTKMYNRGILRQYSAVGFTKKALQHIGNDEPCQVCLDAQALGYVPLNYQFKSKLGQEVDIAPLHPDCHCVLIFPKNELKSISTNYFIG